MTQSGWSQRKSPLNIYWSLCYLVHFHAFCQPKFRNVVPNCWRRINRIGSILYVYYSFIYRSSLLLNYYYEIIRMETGKVFRKLGNFEYEIKKVFRINRRVRATKINYYCDLWTPFQNWFKTQYNSQISHNEFQHIEITLINMYYYAIFTYYGGHYMRHRQLNIYLFYFFHSFVVVDHFRNNNNNVISSISNYRLAWL